VKPDLVNGTKIEDEKIYYIDDNGVRIGSVNITFPVKFDDKARLVYNTVDISSVNIKLVNSSFPTSIIFISVGITISIASLPYNVWYLLTPALLISMLGSIWALVAHWYYYLLIHSSSGNTKTLFTEDVEYIYHVLNAINKALSNRPDSST